MKYSLKLKISILFLVAFFSTIVIAIFSYAKYKEENEKELLKYIHISLTSSFDKQTNSLNFEEFENSGFIKIEDKELIKNIINTTQNSPPHLPNTKNDFFKKRMKNMFEMYRLLIAKYKSNLYVILHVDDNLKIYSTALLKKNDIAVISFIFILIGLVLLFLYIATLKSIKPLNQLRKKIKEFSNGNDDIDCKINSNDEIAEVANEFDNAVKKIKALRMSRQLFLRNVMHELKTPILRGKLSLEMMNNNSQYKNILKKVFERQEVLINDFLQVEKLETGKTALEKESYFLQDIIDYALDIIEQNKENVNLQIENIKIIADFNLFGTALKNLIDNAILYSEDKKASITNKNNQIIIKNKGKALEFNLLQYKEPFFLQGKKQKESRGLGFGLFITINIIELHGMSIEYKHENNENIFTIYLN